MVNSVMSAAIPNAAKTNGSRRLANFCTTDADRFVSVDIVAPYRH